MKTLVKIGLAMVIALAFVGCKPAQNATTNTKSAQDNPRTSTVKPRVDPEIAEMDRQIELAKKRKELNAILKESEIDPCGDYYDDENYMRDYGIATNGNQASAQSASLDAAKANLRKHMAEFVQGLSTAYINTYAGSKPSDDIQRKMEGKTMAAIEGVLNRAEKVCQKYNTNQRGEFVYYAAFQIPVKDLSKALENNLNQLSDEEKLIIDYKDQQFQKFMDSEYQKMLDAKKNAGY